MVYSGVLPLASIDEVYVIVVSIVSLVGSNVPSILVLEAETRWFRRTLCTPKCSGFFPSSECVLDTLLCDVVYYGHFLSATPTLRFEPNRLLILPYGFLLRHSPSTLFPGEAHFYCIAFFLFFYAGQLQAPLFSSFISLFESVHLFLLPLLLQSFSLLALSKCFMSHDFIYAPHHLLV